MEGFCQQQWDLNESGEREAQGSFWELTDDSFN